MKKIVIFGATGNVGSYVHKYACEYFKDRYEVIASGHRQTDFFEKQGQKYVSVDISKAEDFDKLPQEDVYAVIDLAAQIPSYMKGYQPEKYVQSNIMAHTMYLSIAGRFTQTAFCFQPLYLIFRFQLQMGQF